MPGSESICRTGCRQEKGKEKKKKDGPAGAGKKSGPALAVRAR